MLGAGELGLFLGLAVGADALVEHIGAEKRHSVKIAGGQAGG